jgi:hypothetical protein
MVACFFQLPRELRDQIYIYTLHDVDGLYYRTCSDGISRLCRRPRPSFTCNTIIRWFRRFPFHQRHKGHHRENNQLKYVCRRLHIETKGLDVRHNLIIFKDTAKKDALEQCTFLFNQCPTLREAAIKCSLQSFQSNYMKEEFSTIVKHCRTHVNVLVRIYVPYWSQKDPNFILTAIYLLSTLRADNLPIAQFAQAVQVSYRPSSPPFHAQIPNNLRVFPKEEQFCRHTFERGCRANPAIKLPAEQAELVQVMNHVKGWFEHGL